MLVGVILWATAALILIQGVMVALRPGHAHRRLFFSLTALFAAIWAVGIFFFLNSSTVGQMEPSFKVFYIASDLMIWALLAFVAYATGCRWRHVATVVFGLISALVVAWILSYNGGFVISFNVGSPNTVSVEPGLYSLYVLYFAIYSLFIILILVRGYFRATSIADKKRMLYIIIASSVALVFGSVFNLILPWLGNYQLIWIGPISIAIFAAVIHLAIIRYRLFNVRLLTARLLTWVASLIVLAVFYFLLINSIYTGKDAGRELPFVDTILLLLLFIVFYIAMRYMIQFTERAFSSRLLDAELLNKISAKALDHANIRSMLNGATKIISGYLDEGYAAVILFDGAHYSEFGTRRLDLDESQFQLLRNLIDSHRSDVVVTEEVDATGEVYNLLQPKDISAIARIAVVGDRQSSGYLIIGTPRVDLYSDREVRVLSAIGGVLSMAIENIYHYEHIRQFNSELEKHINEATSDLRAANRKLKRIDDSKDDFISMASHQLRTPLTSVKGYIAMLLDGDFGKLTAEQKRVLGEAYGSSERMAFIISDFLDVSRLQTGKFELQKSAINLGELLASEISQLKLTAKSHDVKLNYDLPSDLPTIELDHNKIRQVMMNMIDNAIFYSRADSEVAISLYSQAGKIIFTVRDRGIGVPRGEQSKLFTKFYRGSNARKVRPDGTGVGLYMARKVVVAHGGSIIFDSQENAGSTFGFKLPIR